MCFLVKTFRRWRSRFFEWRLECAFRHCNLSETLMCMNKLQKFIDDLPRTSPYSVLFDDKRLFHD